MTSKVNLSWMKLKKKTNLRDFWQILAILPTSWALFTAFSTVFGVVEILGPFFRAMIFHWKAITREFWNILFDWVNWGIDFNLNDSDKDGLTLALFFLIFGLSSIPTFIKVIRSKSHDGLRKVNWAIFPIASFVSMVMVSLVASSTTAGSSYSNETQLALFGQVIVFFVIMAMIYFLVAFIPTFTTYLFSYILARFDRKNYFKVISPIIFAIYVALWATWIPQHAGSLNLMSSKWVTVIVVSICLFIPMWIPIVDPKKLIKLMLVTVLISVVAFLSLGLEHLKTNASIPGYSFSQEQKSRKLAITEKCKKNLGAVFLLAAAARELEWQHGALKPCECFASELIQNESEETIMKLSHDFSEFMNLSEDSIEYYISRCVPFMKIDKQKKEK